MSAALTSQSETVLLADAVRVITAGESRAREIGSPSNLAVVDAEGDLVAHHRMDGAWIGSIDISINKAFTSRAFDIATKDLAGMPNPVNSSTESMCPTTGES
jgi:uncharacterized protein GlcG (DUF336 family)